MELFERIKFAVEHAEKTKGLTQRQISLAIGHADTVPKWIERKSRRIDPEDLRKLAAETGVSAWWLILEQGDPFATATPVEEVESGTRMKPIRAEDLPEVSTTYGEMPNWSLLAAAAQRIMPGLPAWVWEAVAAARPLLNSPPTAASIADLADYIHKHETPHAGPKPAKAHLRKAR